VVDPQTYLYYMELKNHVSVPSSSRWVPYDQKIEQVMLADFKRLWATNFLDDLSVETYDYPFSNGVVGKVILYNIICTIPYRLNLFHIFKSLNQV
jgi:hypothetical protein